MDNSKSVLQEIATLIHIHKQIPSGIKVDQEISNEITDKYSAEDKKIKVDKRFILLTSTLICERCSISL